MEQEKYEALEKDEKRTSASINVEDFLKEVDELFKRVDKVLNNSDAFIKELNKVEMVLNIYNDNLSGKKDSLTYHKQLCLQH